LERQENSGKKAGANLREGRSGRKKGRGTGAQKEGREKLNPGWKKKRVVEQKRQRDRGTGGEKKPERKNRKTSAKVRAAFNYVRDASSAGKR